MIFDISLWINILVAALTGATITFLLCKKQKKVTDEEGHEHKLMSLFDGTFDAICFTDKNADILTKNPAFKTLVAPCERLTDAIFPEDQGVFKSTWQRVITEKKVHYLHVRILDKNNSAPTMVDMAIRPAPFEGKAFGSMSVHIRDISIQQMHAEKLAHSEQRFRDFSDTSTDWLWEIDDGLQFTFVSSGVVRTLGLAAEQLIGQNLFDVLFDPSQALTKDLVKSRILAMQTYRDVEFWFDGRGDQKMCLRISGVPIFDEKQIFRGYRGAVSNITSTKNDQEHAFRLATTDPLTGLLNRARLIEELERATHFSERHQAPGVLVLIDVDQFKTLNDTYGHDTGDELLKSIADVLKSNTRGTDIVARLGGDEFAIVMQEIDEDKARDKVQRIMDVLSGLQVQCSETYVGCTASIGMVPFVGDADDAGNLMMRADMAMYRAKDLGRNRLYVIGEEDRDNSEVMQAQKASQKEQLKWVDRLKISLDTGDFEVFYQPLVPHIPSDAPCFEALIRLRDEHGHLGAPGVFIDAAEHHGLIKQLDLKMIERCITEQIAMKAKGKHIRVSVNLSGKSLGDPQVIRQLRELINRYPQMEAKDFTFEVTETAALHDPKAGNSMDKIQEFIDSLRMMGFRFALDDFGTGFSSFNYIKHLNVDSIKIDGSFILPLEQSEQDQLFVKAIVDLARGLEMKTVAEFVENSSIMMILQEMGIDFVQGYHLSKPSPDLDMLYDAFKGKGIDDFYSDGFKKKMTERDSMDIESQENFGREAAQSRGDTPRNKKPKRKRKDDG